MTATTRPSPSTAPHPGSTKRVAVSYRRPFLYPAQLAAIFDEKRYSCIEASTKAGKTSGCIVWLAEKALFGKEGQNFWWVAPIFTQSEIAFRRMLRALPRREYSYNQTKMTIRLFNGTVIHFKSADKPDSLYGDDVHAAVVDEASRMKETAWHAIRSTLTYTQGPARLIGNVRGRNWFWNLCRRAEAGDPDMGFHRITAADAVTSGVLDSKEIDDARRMLPEAVFRELYEAVASDDGGNPFGLAAIDACCGGLADAMPVAWGVDLAKSLDWTVLIGLDAAGRVCRLHRWQGPWSVTVTRIREIVGAVPALVDSTGVGDPVLEQLQAGRMNYEGYKFSASSKQQLMEGLAVAIQQGLVSCIPDGPLRSELEVFEYVYTATGVRYSAPEGYHDDTVCALALAVWQLAHRPAVQETIAAPIGIPSYIAAHRAPGGHA